MPRLSLILARFFMQKTVGEFPMVLRAFIKPKQGQKRQSTGKGILTTEGKRQRKKKNAIQRELYKAQH